MPKICFKNFIIIIIINFTHFGLGKMKIYDGCIRLYTTLILFEYYIRNSYAEYEKKKTSILCFIYFSS